MSLTYRQTLSNPDRTTLILDGAWLGSPVKAFLPFHREDEALVGYWSGPGRRFFSDAVADMRQYDHPEAGVARCGTPDGECALA